MAVWNRRSPTYRHTSDGSTDRTGGRERHMLRYLWRNYLAERVTASVKARIGQNAAETQREALEEHVRALEARTRSARARRSAL